ncbi:MAG: hypothetical protein VX546_04895 [Myxococcota bacterium]|nr:hypothetical protein [Myxococcota bacterium]
MYRVRSIFAAGLAAMLIAIAVPAGANEEYDPEYAGHPVRIVAYVLHPIGVIVDYLILRPAFWVGSQEPFATLFGRDD